jgi:hypothetical protein
MRIPNANELRYLVFTTLAYGAQAISYYVYAHPGHEGSIANLDGTPGPLYHALKTYNREFVAIAKELQPLRSMAVQHTAMHEPGCEPVSADAAVPHRSDQVAIPTARIPARIIRNEGQTLSCHGCESRLHDGRKVRRLIGPGELETF